MLKTAGEHFNNFMAAHAHQCPLLYNRTGQTVARHLWIIGRLLDMKDPNTGKWGSTANDLLFHVVATCFAKMSRRLRQPVSKFFIESLQSVTEWTFHEEKRDKPKAFGKDEDRQKMEIEEDKRFVADYLLPIATRGKFPELRRQAQLVKDGKDTRLYTEESYQEFHCMLLELINKFTKSLLELRDPLRTQKSSMDHPIPGDEAFKNKVSKALVYGYALQRLVKGAALKMHLQTIAPSLKMWNLRKSPTPISTEEELRERDEDIQAVHQSVQNGAAVVTSYLDWFKLLISHFDAVDILVSYVTSRKIDSISINILVAPFVDKKLLPWKDLFGDSTLLPAPAVPGTEGKQASNNEILTFITTALAMLPKIKEAERAWNNRDKRNTTICFQTLKTSNVKSWVKCAEKILVKLEDDNLSDQTSGEITSEIQSLRKSTFFFDALVEPKFSSFSGTLHCEACLASLLAESPLASKDILARMEVSQVSDLFLSSESHLL